MKSFTKTKCILIFCLSWNMLLFSYVQGRATNRVYSEDTSKGPPSLVSDSSFPIAAEGLNDANKNDSKAIQSADDNLAGGSEMGANENQQSQSSDDILNTIIQQILPQLLGSLNNGNTNGQMGSENNPQSEQDFSQPQNNLAAETETNPVQYTPAADNDSNSIGITFIPITQDDSMPNSSTASTALVPVQQPSTEEITPTTISSILGEETPAQNNSPTDQAQTDQNYSTTENPASNEEAVGCGSINQADDSQPTLELNQVTASQILYHLKKQYEDYQLDLKQGDTTETYEIIQKTFLREMLRSSSEVTSTNNKNIVSTTYAAYYSTEYTYTFALCKLHHITKGSEDPQNPIHADISSKCSQIMETFSTLNASYEEIISEVTSSPDSDVLKYDDKEGNGDNRNNSNKSNSPNKKVSTSYDETDEHQNLEKDLHGYNDDNFFNRVRSERHDFDQYDSKQSQQIGDSTSSQETKGKKTDSSAFLLSEVREIPKDKSLDDPANGSLRLRKMSNTLRTESEADTKGHTENDDTVVDSDRQQKYDRTDKQLDQLERNNFDDDNKDVGGNIPNAKLQDVQWHYSATVEHIQDVNEQETKPKIQETGTKKYTFRQAVEELTSYIRVLHAFIGDMDKNTADNKNSMDNSGKGAFNELHETIYQQTYYHRQYLKEYFASTNVENGTFSGNNSVDTLEMETETLQTTVEKRFSWLQNADLQGQEDSKSGAPDEIKSNPIQLLWYFEEASFYLEYYKESQVSVPSIGYLPYPNFDVKTQSDSPNGADITFYLN